MTLPVLAGRHPRGFMRLDKYGSEQRAEWARRGGMATKTRYGKEFYRMIRKRRRDYTKGSMDRRSKQRIWEECEREARATGNPAIAGLWRALAKGCESNDEK